MMKDVNEMLAIENDVLKEGTKKVKVDLGIVDNMKELRVLHECRLELLDVFSGTEKRDHYITMQDLIQKEETYQWQLYENLINKQ